MKKAPTKAEEAFRTWYYEHGADWNAAHIKPVWIAAWNAAKEAAAKEAESGTKEKEAPIT